MPELQLAVLIPVYCNQSGLDRSLSSLREADGCFEVVIVDDGSAQPIFSRSALRPGLKVSLLRLERNGGIAAALNHGLRYIIERGHEYLARLDAGDTVTPDRFDDQIRFLDARPECAVVSSFVDFVGRERNPLFRFRAPCEHERIVQRLHINNCLIHPGVMLRVSVLKAMGSYREDVPGAEDYELFLRISRRYQLAVLPKVLTCCEYSTGGISVAGRRTQLRERLRLQIRYFDPASPYSFYGLSRTLAAMVAPHWVVLNFKRVRSQSGGGR